MSLKIGAAGTAVERRWHIYDSQGQIMVLTFRQKSSKPFGLFPRHSGENGLNPPPNFHRCRGTSLMRNTPLLVPYSRTIPRVPCCSEGGGLFLMSEVPLYLVLFQTAHSVTTSSFLLEG